MTEKKPSRRRQTAAEKAVRKGARGVIHFPGKILKPVADFLAREAKRLERRKKTLSVRDPFQDTDRVVDNAASDSDAAEQVGHAQVTAMKKQTDRRLIQIKKALTRIKLGKYGSCERCGQMIDTDRLMVVPETTVCVRCKRKKES